MNKSQIRILFVGIICLFFMCLSYISTASGIETRSPQRYLAGQGQEDYRQLVKKRFAVSEIGILLIMGGGIRLFRSRKPNDSSTDHISEKLSELAMLSNDPECLGEHQSRSSQLIKEIRQFYFRKEFY
ncbi:MAG: hypothetical protein PHT78_03710 [Desulfitobacteriaceae bacterium]|nr:hypothetical protein [Desulfitobacteriaceae bacterium]MDD4752350.1 hypothetical protein [Desulfitobacteriaceae bacterium]